MELVDRFNTDCWETTEMAKHSGFSQYTLVKGQFIKPGQFKYAVRTVAESEDEDTKFDMVTLEGACGKMDPLANIRNCDMLIKDSQIIGVCIDDDCVVKKNLIK